jgi:ectoine hydroxylase-related dioxygenase (phytanoyl-CoA dioxygenase family)
MLNAALSPDQVETFHREGYLVVEDIFRNEDFEPLRREIDALVDARAQELRAEGRIEQLHENAPFNYRLARLVDDHPDLAADYFRAIEGKGGGKINGPAIYDLLTHPRLLDAMESLLGPEVVGSSVYRVRPKLPGKSRGNVPWHQDSGYFASHCDRNLIVTCWIPLVDANLENGGMTVLPRVHNRGIFRHHTGGNANFLVITDENLPADERPVPVSVPLGGALLMTNLTPHCSTPNGSDHIRWSIDLRYQGEDVPTNAFQEPEDFDPEAPEINVACYAPEGDFLVRSQKHPERVLSAEEFRNRRDRYESSSLPAPQRGWEPVGSGR